MESCYWSKTDGLELKYKHVNSERDKEEEDKEEESDTTALERYHVNGLRNEGLDVLESTRGKNANYMDHRDVPFAQCCEQSLGSSSAYTSGYVTVDGNYEEADYKSNDNSSKIQDSTVAKTFMSDVAEKLKHYKAEPYNVVIQEGKTKQKKVIRNYSYLRKNIYTEDLCDRLIEECIIDDEDKQTILNETSSEGRADVMLQTLLQKPSFQFSDIYDRFVTALTPDHNFVVERLNSTEHDQAIETKQIDEEFPYARNSLERKIDSVAEQVDAKTTAIMCFERGGISLMDYLEIYPNFKIRKKAAKILIQSVIKGCPESLYVFINVLKELNCDSTLDILKNFRPQAEYTKEPSITVACQTGKVDTTVFQSTPNGFKIIINMDIPEMVQRLNSSSETTEYILKSVHCEIVKVTKGSVVIILKAYDNCLLQQLQTSEKGYSFLCNLLKEVFRGCVQDDFTTGELQITLTLEENDVPEVIDIEDERSPSSREKIQHRKTFICNELNSNKYTKAFQDQGFNIDAIDGTQQQFTDMSRMEQMKILMNTVLQDESTCAYFIEIVNRLESPITCERILWNGNRKQITNGMLENIEYMLDELIPSHVLQTHE